MKYIFHAFKMACSIAFLIVLSLLFDASAFENCGIPIRDPIFSRIVGGEPAQEGAWPWMVAITPTGIEDLTVLCSGFLIDRKHIIAAAHCFETERNPILFSVMVGSVDLKTAFPYDVNSIVVHEEFIPGLPYHDIAIMKLYGEVNLNYAAPICLPTGHLSIYDFDGVNAALAGYGKVFEDYALWEVTRLYELLNMQVLSNIKCSEFYPPSYPEHGDLKQIGISDSHICAGFPEGGKGSCMGDSGSALMYEYQDRWYAIGVTSFASGIAPCIYEGQPAVHTRITTYLDWIELVRSEGID